MHTHGREAAGGLVYERHRPEETQLYWLVERHYPAFVEHLAEQGKALPAYVEKEFEAYLKCGRLAHGFLRVRCESCHCERLVAFSCKRRCCRSLYSTADRSRYFATQRSGSLTVRG